MNVRLKRLKESIFVKKKKKVKSCGTQLKKGLKESGLRGLIRFTQKM